MDEDATKRECASDTRIGAIAGVSLIGFVGAIGGPVGVAAGAVAGAIVGGALANRASSGCKELRERSN